MDGVIRVPYRPSSMSGRLAFEIGLAGSLSAPAAIAPDRSCFGFGPVSLAARREPACRFRCCRPGEMPAQKKKNTGKNWI